jgi:hypothetical protein
VLVPGAGLAVGPSCLGVGRGVITLAHRYVGDRLAEYTGEMVLLRETEDPGEYLVQCRRGGHYGIDGGVGGNWTALVQHAFQGRGANCKLTWTGTGDACRAFLVARHDIPPGVELCWEYGVKRTLWFLKTLRPWVPVAVQVGGLW